MGLFRGNKEYPVESTSSPKKIIASLRAPRRKVSSTHPQNVWNLFSDSYSDDQVTSAAAPGEDFITPPTIDMDEFDDKDVENSTGLNLTTPTGIRTHFEDGDRKRSAGMPSAPQRSVDIRRSKSRHEQILQRACSISLIANGEGESLKKSVSRKIAHSESRLHSLRSRDSRSVGASSGGVTPRTLSPGGSQNNISSCKNMIAGLSLSPTPSTTKKSADDPYFLNNSTNERKSPQFEDFEHAYGEDEDFLLEEATQSEFTAGIWGVRENSLSRCEQSGISVAGRETSANEARNESDESSKKLPEHRQPECRKPKRPPPLLNANGEMLSGDPASIEGPVTTVFGDDGGLVTGGFKITSEGMVAKPSEITREDSDPLIDGDVPQSERNLVVVRCLKEFKTGATIGSGAAGRVCLAEHIPSQRTMALKVVRVYEKEKRNQLLKELETLSTYVSRFLVRFHGAFYDGSGAVYIALEYMDHGCLSTFVQRVGAIPEKIVQMITMDCLRGLRFLHKHHVLHRDFKTANILLSRRQCCAKLSDFGLARDLNPGVSRVETFVGTIAYMSPERLEGLKYTYASDVWALGVSMMECLLGRYPFTRAQNYFDFIDATTSTNMWSVYDASGIKISSQARDFITQCTHTEPEKRPTASVLLGHPWLAGVRKDAEMFGSWLDDCRIKSMRVVRK